MDFIVWARQHKVKLKFVGLLATFEESTLNQLHYS